MVLEGEYKLYLTEANNYNKSSHLYFKSRSLTSHPHLRKVSNKMHTVTVWQNLAFEDRIRMASQGDFRSSKALLTNQELRLKQQLQQIVDGLC